MDNLKGKTVSLAHGAGGKQTSELIDQVFKAHFANPELTSDDAAVLKLKEGKIALPQMDLLFLLQNFREEISESSAFAVQ